MPRDVAPPDGSSMRADPLQVYKLAYVAKQTYEVDDEPHLYSDAFYALCSALCDDADDIIYRALVQRERVVDAPDFWHSRTHVVQRVQQLLVNLDGRTGWSRARDLLARHAHYGERIHVGVDLMAAFFVDAPALEREWHAHGSANGGTAVRFWRRTLRACAHQIWANESRAMRTLTALDAQTVVRVATGRFGHVDVAVTPGKRIDERSTFSEALKKT